MLFNLKIGICLAVDWEKKNQKEGRDAVAKQTRSEKEAKGFETKGEKCAALN